jgi:ABC-type lipopolysaccharide export system ATPase subunit
VFNGKPTRAALHRRARVGLGFVTEEVCVHGSHHGRELKIGRGPRLLLADELSLGLAPLVVDRLLPAVRQAADAGLGVLLVEQHVRKVLGFADRGYVLRRGRVVLQGAAAELKALLQEIESTYLSAGGAPEAAEDIDEYRRIASAEPSLLFRTQIIFRKQGG